MSDKYTEQVFDYLVEEMLKGPEPPDLSARIEAAWMAEKEARASTSPTSKTSLGLNGRERSVENAAAHPVTARPGNKPHVVAEVVDRASQGYPADVAAQRTTGANDTRRPVSSGHVTPAASASDRQPSAQAAGGAERYAISRSRLAVVLTLAATTLMVIFGVRAYFVDSSTQLGSGNPSVGAEDDSAANRQVGDRANAVPGSKQLARQDETRPARDPIDLNDLPFEVPETQAVPPERVAQAEQTSIPANKLPEREVVGRINSRLVNMWRDLGIEATEALDSEQRAAKIYQKLTGKEIGALADLATLQSQTSSDADAFDVLAFSKSVASNADYANYWAGVVTRQWLRRGALPLDGTKVSLLQSALAKRLASGEPWNGVVSEVLGGPLDAEQNQDNSVFLAALAGGGNHRLVNRIGTNFLNTNLACARCHDARQSGDEGVAGVLGEQDTYWSLLALLKGIEVQADGDRGKRVVVDQQPELVKDHLNNGNEWANIYYDRPDGLVQLAKPHLPDGSNWSEVGQTPRLALAAWIAESPQMDEAVVNQTWKLVFGRQLVPQVQGIDVVADASRRELLAELSAQYRAHGRNLNKLVTWLVSADAFALKPALEGRDDWLQATEEELEQHRLAELAFAAGGTLGQGEQANNLQSSLAVVLNWSSSEPSLDNAEVSLAQPDLSAASTRKTAEPKRTAEPQAPPLSYAIHGERFTEAEIEFVEKLVNSPRLSWVDRVAHIVAINEYETANAGLQNRAREVLRSKQGDQRAALLSLLWAVRNCE